MIVGSLVGHESKDEVMGGWSESNSTEGRREVVRVGSLGKEERERRQRVRRVMQG